MGGIDRIYPDGLGYINCVFFPVVYCFKALVAYRQVVHAESRGAPLFAPGTEPVLIAYFARSFFHLGLVQRLQRLGFTQVQPSGHARESVQLQTRHFQPLVMPYGRPRRRVPKRTSVPPDFLINLVILRKCFLTILTFCVSKWARSSKYSSGFIRAPG